MMTGVLARLDEFVTPFLDYITKHAGLSEQQAKKVLCGVVGGGVGLLALWKLLGPSKYNLPPGPRPLPLIGNLHNLGQDPKFYIVFHELAKKYGDVSLFYLGPYPTVLLSSADVIREAFIRDGVNYADRMEFATFEVLSNGGKDIIGAPYCPRLMLQRKLAFSALRKYASGDALESHVRSAFDAFCKDVDEKGSFQPTPMGYLVTYNILASMTFGKKYGFDDPFMKNMMKTQTDLDEAFSSVAAFFMILPFMKHFPSKVMRIIKGVRDEFAVLLDECLQQHMDTYDPEKLTDFTYHMIHALHEAEKDAEEKRILQILDNEHYRFILLDLFLAGTETSRTTLAWIWLYLAAFPEVQEKAQKEIDQVLGGGQVTVNSREELPYLDAVVHEVMRIMPVTPTGVPRKTTKDTKLNGYDIPKGTAVMSNTWTVHHDERTWEDPYAFKPERWLNENGQYVFQQNGFLPFGVGRRSCIGESFAKLDIHMITTMILQHYNLKPPPGRRIDLSLMNIGNVKAHEQDVIAERRL